MKRFLALCLLILVGLSLTPSLSLAANLKKFGDECSPNGDSECASGDCEEADSENDKIHDKWFCDCGGIVGSAEYCRDLFQTTYPSLPEDNWTCKEGSAESADLDYCLNGSAVEYPLGEPEPVAPGFYNTMTDALKDTPLTESEIDQMLKKPEPRITIPGLKFSDASIDKLKDSQEEGPVYLNFPFLGEYITVVYKYAIVIMSILSVAMIIVSGFQWIVPDSSGENISSAKKRIAGAVTGLILAVGSYTILYTINPELVQFRSIRVRYIAADQHVDYDNSHEPNSEQDTTEDSTNTQQVISSPYQLHCPGFDVGTRKGRTDCMKSCLANLSDDKKSKAASNIYNTSVLGNIDCNVKGTRSLSSIRYIGIHEGGPTGGIPWWWKINILEGKVYGTHYFITRDGDIWQLTDERFKVSHGVFNDNSIGIDLSPGCPSGKDSEKCNYTDAQYDSLNKLIDQIENRVGHKLRVLGHCEVNDPKSAKAHVDPRNFNWNRLGEDNDEHRNGKCFYAFGRIGDQSGVGPRVTK